MMDRKSLIRKRVQVREQFLDDVLKESPITVPHATQEFMEFSVMRRWNSWYPSYFKVDGGCYALILNNTPDGASGHRSATASRPHPSVYIVDPGFRFLEILRSELDVLPQWIDAVFVTHYHPDHMAGLIEFMTLRNKLGVKCDFYLNPTTYRSFKEFKSRCIEMYPLEDGQVKRVADFSTRSGFRCQLEVEPLQTHHAELGNSHNSIGLIFRASFNSTMNADPDVEYNLCILGDTDAHDKYLDSYVERAKNADVLLLHVGTFTGGRKERVGDKHLYFNGAERLLGKLKTAYKSNTELKPLVILSEFGLEMGTRTQIKQELEPFIKKNAWRILLWHLHYRSKQKVLLAASNDVSGIESADGDGVVEDYSMYVEIFAEIALEYLRSSQAQDCSEELVAVLALLATYVVYDGTNQSLDPGFCDPVKDEVVREIRRVRDVHGYPAANDFRFEKSYRTLEKEKTTEIGVIERYIEELLNSGSMTLVEGESGKDRKRSDLLISFCDRCLEFTAKYPEALSTALLLKGWKNVHSFAQGIEPLKGKVKNWFFHRKQLDRKRLLACFVVFVLSLKKKARLFEQQASKISDCENEHTTSGNTLIQVGMMLQDGAAPAATVLTGDVGLRLRFLEREKKIEIAVDDPEGLHRDQPYWMDPDQVEMQFSVKPSRIVYVPKEL